MRANKYGARRATGSTGRSFASTAERDRFEELRIMEQTGMIEALECQPVVPLVNGITWRLDFRYRDPARGMIYEDVKGVETERFRLVVKLWSVFGHGLLRVVKRAGRAQRFRITREIVAWGPRACSACGARIRMEDWSA